jgi:hypothetical protein
MADAVPLWQPADTFTGLTNANVTGQTFADAVATPTDGRPVVATCGAGVRGVGVFAFDQVSGIGVTIYREGIIPVIAGANLTTGQEVQSDASGHAIPLASGRPMGKCMADTTSGSAAPILMQI